MTQQLADYTAQHRAWRRAGNQRKPCPLRCQVYHRLIDGHGYERVQRHLEQIKAILDRAEIRAYAPEEVRE